MNETDPPDGQPMPPADEPVPDSQVEALRSEEKTLGMLCHLLAFCGYIIPFGNIIGPLVIWLTRKDTSPFVDDQGKESLNFQITVSIACIVCIPLVFVCIGGLLLIAIAVADLILVIIAAINAAAGTAYRYPVTWRVIK